MAESTSPSDSASATELRTKGGRLVFIDVMKVIAIAVVIAHHAGQAYGPGAADWAVDDAAMAVWLDAFFRVNAAFGMGLMFFMVNGGLSAGGGEGFATEWFNPRNGKAKQREIVVPAGRTSFRCPDGQDWVLWINLQLRMDR